MKFVQKRLEELRTILRAENMSYDELHELQDLGARGLIDPGDVELLEAAGVPEQQESAMDTRKLSILTAGKGKTMGLFKLLTLSSPGEGGDAVCRLDAPTAHDQALAEIVKRHNAYPDLVAALEAIRNWSNSRDGSAETDEAALTEINGIAARTLLATLNTH